MTLTEPDDAMLKHIEYVNSHEKRAICVLDCRRFEVDDKEYEMTSGTFRNKISKFLKEGKVVFQFRSGHSYYSLPGYKFTKSMTDDHVGVPVKIGRQTPIYKLLKDRPREKQSVHDIRLTFVAKGIWKHVSSKFPICINENNNDVSLKSLQFSDDIIVKITVHHSDTVSIAIACSYRPFVIDIPDILYLIEIMTRIEMEIVGCCRDSGIEVIVIPRYTTWIVKMWHFGVDTLDRYDGEKFHVTVEEAIGDLWRIYTKRMKDGKTKIRCEHQEYPNKPIIDAIMTKFYEGEG
jgi:hypothetical protein